MKNILLYDNLHRTGLKIQFWKQNNPEISIYKEIKATADTLDVQSHIDESEKDIRILLFAESENYFNHVVDIIQKVRPEVRMVWVREE